MTNYMNHYFGAYLEISVLKIKKTHYFRGCKNGHEVYGTQKFCPDCGNRVDKQTKLINVFPSLIVDHLLDEQWEDVLTEITPEQLNETSVILAVGNLDKPRGEWLYLGQYPENNDPYMKDFPSSIEVAKMKRELAENYADVIAALEALPFVEDVIIRAGYIVDREY